jgi:drug/metabolite transporter (DMT)-like permease
MRLAGAPRARSVGIAAALVGAFAYGVNIPAASIVSAAGVSPPNLILIRTVLLVPLLLGYALATRLSLGVPREQWGTTAGLAFAASCTALGYLTALAFIPVPLAVVLFYLFPLWLILLSPLLGQGRPGPGRLIAFAIAFAGILVSMGASLDVLDWRGVALAVFASLACAALFIFAGRSRMSPAVNLFYIQLAGLPLALFASSSMGGWPAEGAILAVWLPLTFACLGYVVGLLLQFVAASRLHPATVGLLFLLEPIVAIVTAAVVTGDRLDPVHWLGIALVLGGVALDLVRDRPKMA